MLGRLLLCLISLVFRSLLVEAKVRPKLDLSSRSIYRLLDDLLTTETNALVRALWTFSVVL